MYNVLSKPRKRRAIGYFRLAGKEYIICPELLTRNVKASQSISKYDYQSLSKAHSLIKEKIYKK
jgi:hypothetical protein